MCMTHNGTTLYMNIHEFGIQKSTTSPLTRITCICFFPQIQIFKVMEFSFHCYELKMFKFSFNQNWYAHVLSCTKVLLFM